MTYIAVYGFFILCSVGQACVLPYLTMFFKYLGLSALQAGLIRSVQTLIALCSIPFWFHFTSKFNEKQTAIGLNLFLSMVAYLCVTTIPPLNPSPYFKYCHFNLNASPSTSIMLHLNTKNSKQNDSNFVIKINKTAKSKKPLKNIAISQKDNIVNLLKKPEFSHDSLDSNYQINNEVTSDQENINWINKKNPNQYIRNELLNMLHPRNKEKIWPFSILKQRKIFSTENYSNPFLFLMKRRSGTAQTNVNSTQLSYAQGRSELTTNQKEKQIHMSKLIIPQKDETSYYYSFNHPRRNILITRRKLSNDYQDLQKLKPYPVENNEESILRNKIPALIKDGGKEVLLKTLFSNQNYGFQLNYKKVSNINKKDPNSLQRIHEEVDLKENPNDNQESQKYYSKQIPTDTLSLPKKRSYEVISYNALQQASDDLKGERQASENEIPILGFKQLVLNDDDSQKLLLKYKSPRKNRNHKTDNFKIESKKKQSQTLETNSDNLRRRNFPNEMKSSQNSDSSLSLETDWSRYLSKAHLPKYWNNVLQYPQNQIYLRDEEGKIKQSMKKDRNDMSSPDNNEELNDERYKFLLLQRSRRHLLETESEAFQFDMSKAESKYQQLLKNNLEHTINVKSKQKQFARLQLKDQKQLEKNELSKSNTMTLIKRQFKTKRRKRTIQSSRTNNTGNVNLNFRKDISPLKSSIYKFKYHANISVKPNIQNIFKIQPDYLRSEIWSQEHLITFISVLIIFSLGELLGSSYVYLADDAWYQYLDFLDETELYGANHSWCLIMSAIATFLVSSWVANANCHIVFGINRFLLYFFTYGAIMGFALILSMFIPVHTQDIKASPRMKGKYFVVLCEDMDSILCSVTTILNGLWIGSLHDFLLWRVAELGGQEYHFGGTVAIGIISDVFAPKITALLKQKINLQHIISVATVLYGVRFLYFSYLWHPSAVFGGQLLQGFTSGVLQVAMKTQMEKKIDTVPRNSALLLHMSFCSSGYVIGTFLSGLLYDSYGPNFMFQIMATSSFLWCVIVNLVSLSINFKNKYTYSKFKMSHYSNVDTEDEEDWLEAALENEML